MRLRLLIAALSAGVAATVALAATQPVVPVALPAPKALVVVELFQSQGCSSCPPANANINALIAARPDVLALSYGVTYWDQLGWKDGFASAANTQRQRDYASGLGHDNVWTPQVVVDGRADLVGNDARALDRAVAAARQPAGAPKLELGPDGIAIGHGSVPRGGADVWLIRYDPRTIDVAVKAGENGGKTLPHRNIVRALTRLGSWDGTATYFAVPDAAPGLRSAILVQGRGGGGIIAAAHG